MSYDTLPRPEDLFPDKVENTFFKRLEEHTNREHRVVFFGDSFVESYDDDRNWTRIVSDSFELPRQHINYGAGGSSLLFSINNFFNYIENDYNEEDYIVFITTSHYRLPKVHSNVNPRFSSMLLDWVENRFLNKSEKYTQDRMFVATNEYYSSHIQVVNYAATVLCNAEDHRHQLKLMQNYLNNLPNKTLFLNAFPTPKFEIEDEFEFTLLEVAGITNFKEIINHMSQEHNEILAKQVLRYFDNNDIFVFDMVEYK
jgi:hypothetical protein